MKKEQFLEILKYGIQAPSGDNIQPWRIFPANDYNYFRLEIAVEDNFFDAGNLCSLISGGTFLRNIKIGADKQDYEVGINLNPDEKSLEIAEVSFSPLKKQKKDRELSESVFKRATLRTAYSTERLPDSFYKGTDLINKTDKEVHIYLTENRETFNYIAYQTELVRFGTRGAHETVVSSLRCNKKEIEKRDGLDYRTLGIPLFPKIGANILKSWKLAKLFEKTRLNKIMAHISTKNILKSSGGLGFLTIENYSKENLIKAGEAWQDFWLNLSNYNGFMQPYAALPIFSKRIEFLGDGSGFSKPQIKKITELKDFFHSAYGLKDSENLITLFRFGIAKPPKIKTLRKSPESFLESRV